MSQPAGDAAPQGQADGQQHPGQADGQQAQQQGQPAAALADWDGRIESLPAGAQAIITELRRENASRRTGANDAQQQAQQATAAQQQMQEAARAFAKAAGIELPGDPDPEALVTAARQAQQTAEQERTEAQNAARTTAVELAVYRSASKAGADPDALLDSRTFLAKVNDLDPKASDFGAKIEQAMKDTVAGNSKLKAGQAPPAASGSDSPGGGQTGGDRMKPPSLEQAAAAHFAR